MIAVDCVIPVYNEEHVLAQSVAILRNFLKENLASYSWSIVIADNASIDRTLAVAQELSQKYPEVRYIHLDRKGRGRALRAAWRGSAAQVLSYMDVDLSTDISFYPPLVKAVAEEGYDVAIGSRLMPASQTTRSFRREFTSRSYNLLIKAMFLTHFVDAQCGFKAVSRRAARELLPLVQNQEWFFDTELLILAEQRGYLIKEIPVVWVEDPDTRVNVLKTAMEDIRGLLRMRLGPLP